jgi:hypothetical protein
MVVGPGLLQSGCSFRCRNYVFVGSGITNQEPGGGCSKEAK